ncbi:alpha/beta fold hydrolase [Glaciimonas sp. CA11.2]|uniref:YheT family hydrolase n=1 Tax=unclassified Glaciimonas TaxID=2644401 RepID=UPI002AB42C34|nr:MULTISPECIES: alpha/beta fold hydrolase [unclassified Glaciimonas]MDY7546668.1 alpha/beta fold hydrolase [Glaciimonas sp. CA11.2]MEB0011793.1 alpha/beta fold hydrolase [Glaciimonas sp. Cout2]MEB0080651.1 alpha/beta fold hydrolase [Glaciimonas sp. Gout2]MEB0162123.1 alpha/beta fold hydrolase [Glaciimonas sp. CA11.2]
MISALPYSPYIAPLWLPGGHLQTIYPSTCIAKPEVAYRRERWTAPDGDFIDIDFVDGQPGKPMIVMFHGLEGSSASHYSRAMMAYAASLGWSGAAPHFRGCSGEINLAPRFYHSGDTAEVDWILRRLADSRSQKKFSKLYATGASMGGNALLCWLGESQQQANLIDAACAISAPLDLAGGGNALSQGFNMLYTRVFLRTMKTKALDKLAQFPSLFDRERMLSATNLHAFDNVVTAPLHGFRDADDYWNRASAKHVLSDIVVPTLILNAQNDPFLPPRHLPRSAASSVTLEYPAQGGHVGFPVGSLPGRVDWLPRRVVQFLLTA